MAESVEGLSRAEYRRRVRFLVGAEVVLAVIWVILGRMLSYGTLMAVVNIVFLLLSLFLGWAVAFWLSRYRFSTFISGVVSALIWVLIFGLFRGFF